MTRQFANIQKDKAGTFVKRAWCIGQLTVVVLDKTLAQELQIVDGTFLEQVPLEDGILLRIRGEQK